MAEIFKFFNSAPGDERWHYASDFADYFGDVLSSGLIHKNNVPGLQVTIVTNSLKTRVDVGQALIKGYSYQNTTPIELTHDITEIGLNRIDRIVLRLDLRNANRYIKAFVKKGTEAVNPVPPTLQRDQYIYELSLAQVRVNSNSTVINPLSLVDERMKEDLCGVVHSLISVPTSVFQQQWDYWFNVQSGVYTAELLAWIAEQKVVFNNWKVQEQSDFTIWSNTQKTDFAQWRSSEQTLFETWFTGLQELLDENVAATLTAKVQSLEQQVTTHLADLVKHGVYGVTTGTNALTMTLENVTAYPTGMLVAFKNTTANTSAVTLNVNGLGAKSIKKANGSNLAAGNLKAGGVYQCRFDGTNFMLLGEGGEYGTATATDVRNTKTFGTENGVIQGGLDLSKLIASNIREGITIDGILGTLTPLTNEKKWATGSKSNAQEGSKSILEVTGLTFKPQLVVAQYGTADWSIYSVLSGLSINRSFFNGGNMLMTVYAMNSDGFKIEVGYDTNQRTYKWYAFA